jgi:hypothetical protein
MKRITKFCLFLFLALSTKSSFAQWYLPQSSTTNLFKLNFLLPGISYEQNISKYSTLYLTTYMDGIIPDKYFSPSETTRLYFIPSFNAEFRSYSLSMKKREFKSLRTALNSANYFEFAYVGRYTQTDYYSDHRWLNQFAAAWGIQRNAPRGFSVDAHIGLIYTPHASSYIFYAPIDLFVQLSLGYRIGKID